MKKIISFVFIIAFAFSLNYGLAQAGVLMQGFGGRVITAPTPGVQCPAGTEGSPFTVIPAGSSPMGLYVGGYHTITSSFNLNPGVWVLGLYIPVPIPECATTTVPPAPVTGYRTFFHGTSSVRGI